MLYVHQSLGPDEEILAEARFHWMYTINAVYWIMLGLAFAIAIGYAAIWWDVTHTIRAFFPGLPDSMFDEAWTTVVNQKGGYLKIIWAQHPSLRFTMLGSVIFGIFVFANMMVVKATTEIAITNTRLIYKRGLVARVVGELNIDRIEGVAILQGVSGRIFGYGRLIIRGMGVGEILLPPIDNPVGVQKKIYEARSLQEKGKNSPNDYDEDF